MVTDEKHTIVTVTDDRNHNHHSHHNIRRTIFSTTIVVILLLVGITALVLWLLYHPHNPKFTVVGAAVYGGNTSGDITAMQFTVVTRNPNNHVSIYYDHLAVFLSYENRPITPPLMLPPLYHEGDTSVAMSPIWPVSSAVVNGLVTDEGVVSLRLVLTGKLRWKAGNIVKTSRKGVYVECDVLVGLKRGVLGQVPLVRASVCRVDI